MVEDVEEHGRDDVVAVSFQPVLIGVDDFLIVLIVGCGLDEQRNVMKRGLHDS